MSRRLLACGLFLLVTAGVCPAQSEAYRLFEFKQNGAGGCVEYFRVVDLFEEMKKQPGSKGFIVIYAGDKKQRFGNALAYAKQAREFIVTTVGTTDISVVVAEGKSFFNEEFWIIPKDAAMPELATATLDWNELTDKYHFSSACLMCEPSYYQLTDFQPNFEDFAIILNQYPKYSGLVTVHNRADVAGVTEELTAKLKLPRNRYRIQIMSKDGDDWSVNLFVVPKKSIQAQLN